MPRFGPGVLLAAASIGGSHLLLAPEAGARHGLALAWLLIAAHGFKYFAFEAGPRFTAATGESLLEGYARVPGPRNWALWLGLTDMVLESVGVLAAVAGLTATFLHGALGGLPLSGWTALVMVASIALNRRGGFGGLQGASLALMGLLAVGTMIAFLAAPPLASPSVDPELRSWPPRLPAGSWLLAAAILGWMPTGLGVSIWHSLWTQRTLSQADPRLTPSQWTTWARRDMARGYGFSLVMALLFLYLGASVLRPADISLASEVDVALELARLYHQAAPWLEPVFLCVAFAAMFSTTCAVMDGFPRTFVVTLDLIRDRPRCEKPAARRLYVAYLYGASLLGLSVLAAVPDPVRLIEALGAVTLIFTPIYGLLNHWCVTRLVAAEDLRPGRAWRFGSGLGILGLSFAAWIVVGVVFQ